MGTFFGVIRKKGEVEEALAIVSLDVVSSQSSLQRSWDGELDNVFIWCVCPCMARWAPNFGGGVMTL